MERQVLVIIDQDTCIGCGLCAVIEPNVFGFASSSGPASVYEAGQEVSEVAVELRSPLGERVLEAVQECPVNAIKTAELPAEFVKG